MTPPKEWGDADELPIDFLQDNNDRHESSDKTDPADTERPDNHTDGASIWRDDNTEADSPESQRRDDHADVAAVWLDHAETDDYINTPHDEGRATVKHDDEEYRFDSVNDEHETVVDGAKVDGADFYTADADLLTDHHIASENRSDSLSLWPALTVGLALILLVIGGWGAISERSNLTARIAELEQAITSAPQRGDLSISDERALREENARMTTELTALREQVASLVQQLVEQENTSPPDATYLESSSLDNTPNAQAYDDQTNTSGKTGAPTEQAGALATQAAGRWFVNVAAYAQKSVAQSWVDKLATSVDKEVVSSAVIVNGQTLYRVRVVGLPDKATAKSLASLLEKTYNIGPLWVGKADADDIKAANTSTSETGNASSGAQLNSSEQPSKPVRTLPPEPSKPNRQAPVELRNFAKTGGWFIYIDTYSQSADADAKASEIRTAGHDAKVAVEYRSGELFYRVQVVGISSREEGEAIAETLSKLYDMPNLQLRQY